MRRSYTNACFHKDKGTHTTFAFVPSVYLLALAARAMLLQGQQLNVWIGCVCFRCLSCHVILTSVACLKCVWFAILLSHLLKQHLRLMRRNLTHMPGRSSIRHGSTEEKMAPSCHAFTCRHQMYHLTIVWDTRFSSPTYCCRMGRKRIRHVVNITLSGGLSV